MNRCKKTIIIVFFCFLGDIAYSTEKYSKTSQKNFNTVLRVVCKKIHKSRIQFFTELLNSKRHSQNKKLLSMKKKNLLK